MSCKFLENKRRHTTINKNKSSSTLITINNEKKLLISYIYMFRINFSTLFYLKLFFFVCADKNLIFKLKLKYIYIYTYNKYIFK